MNKKSAKDLLKNKQAMQRLRNERVAKNALMRLRNMTCVGKRPVANIMTFSKKKSPIKQLSPKNTLVSKNTPSKNKANDNAYKRSISAYKYLVAIPYAVTGLHNPRSPGYHDELVNNLKNYQAKNPNLLPVHEKNWAVEQIKRNVYKVLNKNRMNVNTLPIITPLHSGLSKTRKLLKNRRETIKRKTVKSPKRKNTPPKTITNAYLKSSIANTLKSVDITKVGQKSFRKQLANRTGRPELADKKFKERVLTILNSFLLNQYASNKTNVSIAKSCGC